MDGSVLIGRQMSPYRMPAPRVEIKSINLALQGGGAHGAFTWGVLDRLLEEERLAFDGISAASAGAVNAAVLAWGLAEGGRQGAKRALAKLWRRVAHLSSLTPLQPSLADRHLQNPSLELSPAFMLFDVVTRLFSPYQLNPFNYNPLRQVLTETVNFDAFRSGHCPVKLFLSATNVRTGKIKVFENDAIGPDAVLASALLAADVSSGRDRRRALLGRRVHGQSGDLSAHLPVRQPRRCNRSYQSARTGETADDRGRNHEPHQRDQLQFLADA